MSGKFRRYFKGDPVIWAVILLLSVFSLLSVYSATGTLAYRYQGGNTYYYIIKHASILLVGIIIIYTTHLIPYKYFSRLSQLFLMIAIPLLLFTLFFGRNINQAHRFLAIPGLGLTIQPSDLGKLALIMYVARILSRKQEVIGDYREAFLPAIWPILLVCVLILPANLSTALMLFSVCVILMFIGRIRIKHILAFAGVMVVVITLFVSISLLVDKEGRIITWWHRIEQFVAGDSEENYQANQAKIAIERGGLIQLRPGKSIQRNFIPHPYSDFIYAIIIEEYGLAGGVIVLALYMYLLFRAAVMVRKSSRTFPAFVAIGLALLITMQAMINMAVAIGLVPVTGQPLPMISMGGSSMLFTCLAFGVILSVSRGVRDQQTMPLSTSNLNENHEAQPEHNH